jgi:hypothetical protein
MSTRETRGFLDPASFPAAALLESNFDVIAAELAECDDREFVDWGDAAAYSGVWRVLGMYYFRPDHVSRPHLVDVERRGRFRRTRELVRRVPGLVGAGFTWIGPQTIVFPHSDEQLVRTVRVHMGMRCDPGCTMQIGEQVRTWELARCFVFDSADLHIVRHVGTRERVSLLLEIDLARAHDPLLPT